MTLTARDLLVLVALAGGSALAVGLVGLGFLRRLRRRSLPLSLTVVALVPVLAVLTGTLVGALVMFLSPHDFGVVLVLVGAGGVVALGIALLLGRQLVAGSRAVQAAARSVGAGEQVSIDRPATAELAELSRELEQAGDRLAQAKEREHMLEASRRELITWVSHDLRTPLAGLRAMAEALEDGVADDPDRYHKQMRVEVERLSTLVDDLFELSRITSGTLPLTVERLALADLVDGALAGAEALAAARRVRLRAVATTPVPVRADGAELARVVDNLLINAIRHTHRDGTVTVAATEQGGEAVLTVTDGCGGIPEPDLGKVFEVAWRGDAARTPGDGGAGLGLAIARGIVEAHDGRIGVANVEGGCRFEVRLPLAASPGPG